MKSLWHFWHFLAPLWPANNRNNVSSSLDSGRFVFVCRARFLFRHAYTNVTWVLELIIKVSKIFRFHRFLHENQHTLSSEIKVAQTKKLSCTKFEFSRQKTKSQAFGLVFVRKTTEFLTAKRCLS